MNFIYKIKSFLYGLTLILNELLAYPTQWNAIRSPPWQKLEPLKCTVVNERGQFGRLCMPDNTHTTSWKRRNYRDRKQLSGFQGPKWEWARAVKEHFCVMIMGQVHAWVWARTNCQTVLKLLYKFSDKCCLTQICFKVKEELRPVIALQIWQCPLDSEGAVSHHSLY